MLSIVGLRLCGLMRPIVLGSLGRTHPLTKSSSIPLPLPVLLIRDGIKAQMGACRRLVDVVTISD